MAYQEKPMLPEMAQANVGDKVILEDVTVTNEIWRGGNSNTIVLFGVERNGSEAVVKVFDGSCPASGTSITAVGKKSEYNGKFSLEVSPKFGGGIAFEGDPLHTVQSPTQQPTQQPTQSSSSGSKSFLIFFYDRVLTKMNAKYKEESNAAAATHSVMIAYYRNDISEEELERWISGPSQEEVDDIPF